jgi:flagellar biosynthesis protein FliR
MRNLIALAILGVVALFVSVFAYGLRSKHYPQFNVWWDAEGLPIFLISCFILAGVFLAEGWLR